MHSVPRTVRVLGLVALLAGPVAAQDTRELIIQVNGGGLAGLANLDRSGGYDTKASVSFSGGLGLKLVDRLVVRAEAAYASTPIRFQGADIDADFTRLFASLIAQIQYPRPSGLNPYVLLGGGGAFIDQHSTPDPKKTVAHFLTGLGIGYRLGGSGLSVLAEGRMYMYQPRGLVGGAVHEPRVMWDGAFGAGLSYAFALGAGAP